MIEPKVDKELLTYVLEELSYYLKEWTPEISDTSIRRGSASLRNLLHEGKLQLAWKQVGFVKQPIILAPTLDHYLDKFNIGIIESIQAGGALSKYGTASSIALFNKALSEAEIKVLHSIDDYTLKQFCLNEYLDSTCIIIKGKKISRKELIGYISNKLGGTHFDQDRNINKELEQKFILLDDYRKTTTVIERNPIMFELLSTIHYLQNSDDIIKLRKQLEIVVFNQSKIKFTNLSSNI